jgi:hypothetical protein
MPAGTGQTDPPGSCLRPIMENAVRIHAVRVRSSANAVRRQASSVVSIVGLSLNVCRSATASSDKRRHLPAMNIPVH